MPLTEISKIIGRSPQAVQFHASSIGLRKLRSWTLEEIIEIDKLRPVMPLKDIARYLGRTPESIYGRMSRIRKYESPLTSEEIIELLRLDPRTSIVEIARHFKRSLRVIREHVAEIGLEKYERWTPEEDRLLELSSSMPRGLITKLIGRSADAIKQRAAQRKITSERAVKHVSSHNFTMRFLQRVIIGLDPETHEKYGRAALRYQRIALQARNRRYVQPPQSELETELETEEEP
jgi:arsenate reductase-like glutaredoxin family protein